MDCPPPSRSCDLREAITGAIEERLKGHASQGPRFKAIVDPRLPREVLGDPKQLKQSLDELLEKAATLFPGASFTLLVYEKDYTNRSILSFEIKGTELNFALEQYRAEVQAPIEAENLSILVAEDNAVNQQMAIECLRSLHLKCEVVSDGRAAVEASAKVPYDVIFMDVHMPIMDGLQATREIRRLAGGKRPYIAALTAYCLPGDRARCLEAGMNDYIAKPCRVENLALVLEKARILRAG